MARWQYYLIGLLAALLIISVAALIQSISASNDRDTLYQVSAYDLLVNGSYGGRTTVGELKTHGDFGIGTYQGLDGEMIVLDGTAYQARSDGLVQAMGDTSLVPFAEVTYFNTDSVVDLSGEYNYSTLTVALADKLSAKDDFYAVRIHATFPYIKVRAPPAQHEPYPPIAEALKNQSVFELHNVTGTIVGYYTPAYAKGIGAPGFHFHFITDDRKAGGHVLDLDINNPGVMLDDTPRYDVDMASTA
jgi:acetolactate decarboxylase